MIKGMISRYPARRLYRYLHSLGSHSHTTNVNDISVDNTAGGGAITVGDGPGLSALELRSGGVGRVVNSLAIDIGSGSVRRVNPQIGGTGVKVQVQDLSRSTDGHGGSVGIIQGVDGGADGAALITLEELVVNASGVGHGGGEPVRDGRLVLEVGLVHGQSAIVLVVLTLDLVNGRAALVEGVASGDGRGNSGAGEGSRDEELGGNHLVVFKV